MDRESEEKIEIHRVMVDLLFFSLSSQHISFYTVRFIDCKARHIPR
ncbi:hypothetical protein HNR31_000201 [Anoxybacillus caldiproteolyticus]|uniref:Uncharacterized protein n=1 Tax=Thermaerobacillus caldiproteolyticus TaxID=247480 RepID=A0A7V9Z3N5_9BACL|nr:hypothetical protein [Anoxybacillus caldiproteolyticus]